MDEIYKMLKDRYGIEYNDAHELIEAISLVIMDEMGRDFDRVIKED